MPSINSIVVSGPGLFRLLLLVVCAVLVIARPRRLHIWIPPVIIPLIGLATGAVDPDIVGEALRPLASPLVFLAGAVPLALMLDRIGFFEAAAAAASGGHRLRPSLWVFGAAVTAIFNLDTSVVLLTPLYVRIAHRNGLDPLLTAFQPVLLASLASSFLPVSNLTNLIVASRFSLSSIDFLIRLAPASLAACIVGWLVFRRTSLAGKSPVTSHAPVNAKALRTGLPVVLFLIVGFTLLEHLGIPAWCVVWIADAWLLTTVRYWSIRWIPWDAFALACGLGILATAVAPDLPIQEIFASDGAGQSVAVVGVSAFGAATMNNLPATLIGAAVIPAGDPHGMSWPLLIGVNMGPLFLVTGSLAGLLWMSVINRLGLRVTARQYSKIGLQVGFPALAVATIAVVIGGLVSTS